MQNNPKTLKLKQFVPSEFCLKCFGCCRFREHNTIWAPAQYTLKAKGEGCYICPNLNEGTNHCKIYLKHPIDCQLYPFLLVKKGNKLSLGVHNDCCFIHEKHCDRDSVLKYADYLVKELGKENFISAIKANPFIAADYSEGVELLADLDELYIRAFTYQLNELSLEDKPMVERYLKCVSLKISAYNFCAIFIWRDLFDIFWTIIEGRLCIFYKDKMGMFMALPPLGETKKSVIQRSFEIMSFSNQNNHLSRIENVSEGDLNPYQELKLKAKPKDREYVYLRTDVVNLSGGRFKGKRSSYNFFCKNYKARILKYKNNMQDGCIELFKLWTNMRKNKFSDSLYVGMLEDSLISFKAALKYYNDLKLAGYVVMVDNKIKACSFGYPLGNDTFCILFEVCDLALKGISQFIFREFCRKLSGYKYINVMGASELENLKHAKISWRPEKEIGVYNIYQNE